MGIISASFCTIICTLALTESTIVNHLYVHGDLHLYYKYLSEKAQLHFLFIKPGEDDENKGCFLGIFVTILRIVILLPSILIVPLLDVFVLMVPFSLWRIMCAFENYCKNTIGAPKSTEKVRHTIGSG